MTNPLLFEPDFSERQDAEAAELNTKDPDDSGYFRTLEEIVNRVYPQPPEE